MGNRTAFATAMQVGSRCGRSGRAAAFAVAMGIVFWGLTVNPTIAQVRPGPAPDPIDRSRGLSTQPRPALAAPDQPTERLVPEKRQRDPATGQEVVTPPHYERSTTDRLWQTPPPTSYGTPAESPTRLPGR